MIFVGCNILSEALHLFRRGSDLSLRNAEIWLEDANLLMEHKTWGHAYALLTFADEELIKAFVFWVLAEEIIEIDLNKAQKLFRRLSHSQKHQIIFYLVIGLVLDHEFSGKGTVRPRYFRLSEEDIEKSREVIRTRETWRQRAIYVDLKKGKLHSPDKISKEMVVSLRGEILHRLEFIRNLTGVAEPAKEKIVKALKDVVRTTLSSLAS